MRTPVCIALAFLTLFYPACDQIGGQASRTVEQRVQQEANKLMDKALGSADKVIDTLGGNSDEKQQGLKPTITTDGSLQVHGLAPTTATLQPSAASVYCTAERIFEGRLEARFLDKAGVEIGRSQQQMSAPAGSAQFVEFKLDPRTPVADITTINMRVPK